MRFPKKSLSLVLILTGGLTLVNANENRGTQKLVKHVDLDRFMGDWYVIASIPTAFEKGAVNAVETYRWNEEKGIVEVSFSYRKDHPGGKSKHMTQKGFIHDKQSNAEWRVQPLWPLRLPYLIIDLAEDYSDTVIGVPNRKYLWIMARESHLPQDRYEAILEAVAAQGYDLTKIQKVPQIWN